MNAIPLLLVGACLSGRSALPEVSSSDLIERAREWDGQTIVYRGEAVGEVMRRGRFAWVNLHDGASAIGVWFPFRFAERIKILGDYFHSGDIVRITGVFHRACAEHGGDLDIHAVALEKVADGSPREHPGDWKKLFAGGGLCLLAAALAWRGRGRARQK